MVLGYAIVLLSALLFCFQNIIVRVLFNEYQLFGLFKTGGFVSASLEHSFLLLLMRMVVVVPLMAALAPKLYPPTWQDIAVLRQPQKRWLLLQSLACGLLMFLYLSLLYIAIALIPTGIALTLFFVYPLFTALFAGCIGDRPSRFRWFVISLILVGIVLIMPRIGPGESPDRWIGIATGIGSGIIFALYTVQGQQCMKQLHPVPFTWLNFAVTLLLSLVSLSIWHLPTTDLLWSPLWIGGGLSAFFTFSGHLLNNIGIRRIGATTASMIAATNPALTAILAGLTIQEQLSGIQIAGIGLVTLSVGLLSQDRPRAAISPD
jgi:drug/metabolite transporter (DMT)-like permease